MIENQIEKTIKDLEKIKNEIELKHVHHDTEYYTYCKKYLDDAIFDLKGVLYYMNK